MRNAYAAALVAVLVLAPRLALACPVCMGGRDDETRTAFILTTVFLTVLPLSLIGGVVWWLSRRIRTLEEQRRVGASPHLDPAQAAARTAV
jgi:high-affinity Fe2+/Pb2+ permease